MPIQVKKINHSFIHAVVAVHRTEASEVIVWIERCEDPLLSMATVSSGVFVDASTAITSGELKLYSVWFPHIWTDRLPVNDTYTQKKKIWINAINSLNIFKNLVQFVTIHLYFFKKNHNKGFYSTLQGLSLVKLRLKVVSNSSINKQRKQNNFIWIKRACLVQTLLPFTQSYNCIACTSQVTSQYEQNKIRPPTSPFEHFSELASKDLIPLNAIPFKRIHFTRCVIVLRINITQFGTFSLPPLIIPTFSANSWNIVNTLSIKSDIGWIRPTSDVFSHMKTLNW